MVNPGMREGLPVPLLSSNMGQATPVTLPNTLRLAFVRAAFNLPAVSACCHAPSKQTPLDVPAAESFEWLRVGFAGFVAAQSMIFGLAVNLSPPSGTARLILHTALAVAAIVVFALVGSPVLRAAWEGALRRKPVFEHLFLAGILGAFAASLHATITGVGHVYYEVVAVLLAIYTFGRIIGERRRDATQRAADALGLEFSRCEKRAADGSFVEIPVREVCRGDVVQARAGTGVPVDGVVVGGTAFVVETALTGEPFPVVRRVGDAVLAGSRVVDRTLRIEATAPGCARRLDGLIGAVRTAREHGSRLEREADRWVAWFLPCVLVASIATFAFWTARSGWIVGVFNGLAVLLVACPCSMGLATPVAIWSTLERLARRGLVVHDSDLVERLARVDVAIFDKTGTLGHEELELVDFATAESVDRRRLRAEVAALESESGHPLARAFRGVAGSPLPVVRSVSVLPGEGIEGWVDGPEGGAHLRIGNEGVLPKGAEAESTALRGLLVGGDAACRWVYVVQDGRVAGVALLREKMRASARDALARLDAMGIDSRVLTGDRSEAAASHGLANVESGLLPAEKADRVMQLRSQGREVLFVGDGINDAPAMANASISLAMNQGSALAREAAMGEILGGDLSVVPEAVGLCRGALRTLRTNLWFAGAYNLIGMGLAAAGVLHPVAAALLMLASSFTVTARALRGTRISDPSPVRRTERPLRAAAGSALPRVLRPGAVVALFVAQAFMLPWMGDLSGVPAAGMTALFLVLALLAAWALFGKGFDRSARMAVEMFSFGGAAMLVGWWADAGFGAVVRDGVCLCGCPTSTLGAGLISGLNWMDVGMIAASLPAFFVKEAGPVDRSLRQRGFCWAAGLVGMLVGMQLAGWVMAQVPVATNPHGHFFATYAAMMTGMSAGMLLGCGLWNNVHRSASRDVRHSSP